jgi:hypothetical protein
VGVQNRRGAGGAAGARCSDDAAPLAFTQSCLPPAPRAPGGPRIPRCAHSPEPTTTNRKKPSITGPTEDFAAFLVVLSPSIAPRGLATNLALLALVMRLLAVCGEGKTVRFTTRSQAGRPGRAPVPRVPEAWTWAPSQHASRGHAPGCPHTQENRQSSSPWWPIRGVRVWNARDVGLRVHVCEGGGRAGGPSHEAWALASS